jgi:hypothetical protein
MHSNQRVSAFRCPQPFAPVAFAHAERDLPLPKSFRSTILASRLPGTRRMSAKNT